MNASRTAPTALLAHPSDSLRQSLAAHLARLGFDCLEAIDGVDAWEQFRRHHPNLILATHRLSGIEGLEFLVRVRSSSTAPFLLEVPAGDVGTAVLAARSGATEVLQDSLRKDGLRVVTERLAKEVLASPQSRLCRLIPGKSAVLQRLREKIASMSALRVPVLFVGEPGTGRTHLACILADLRSSDERRLIRVSAEAAQRTRVSQPEPVDFVLSDVAGFPRCGQEQWSRHLAEADVAPAESRVQVMATTDANLRALADIGSFDRTLAEQLSRFTIEVPPLRSYLSDLRPLVQLLAAGAASRLGRATATFTPQAIATLQEQPWPGNVQQLRETVEQLVAFSPSGRVTKACVSTVLSESARTVIALRRSREARQRTELVTLLHETGGNLAEVARRLDLSRGAIIYRAQKFGLLPERRRRSA